MASSHIIDQVGRVLGQRYLLLSPIGTGASANVFLAQDNKLSRKVAIKILHPGLSDESFLKRFRLEAQIAAGLSHPNIMKLYDWGEGEDGSYLVLEYLSGGNLRSLLDQGNPLSPSQVAQIGIQALTGLNYAHRRGLIHRDIKPANLLFDEDSRVVVGDFGLARALAEAAWTEPSGSLFGTVRYACPEQAQGETLNVKADLYSLGLVLIEALTLKVPFSADTTIATLMGRVGKDVLLGDDLGELGKILEKATKADPIQRIDGSEFLKELGRISRNLDPAEPLALSSALKYSQDPQDVTQLGIAKPEIVPTPDFVDPKSLTVANPKLDRASKKRSRNKNQESQKTQLIPAIEPAVLPDSKPLDEPTIALPVGEMSKEPKEPKERKFLFGALIVLLAILIGVSAALGAFYLFPSKEKVPSLVGVSYHRAQLELKHLGLNPKIKKQYDSSVSSGQIISQKPSSGSKIPQGSSVYIDISKGPAPRLVPSLSGLTQSSAIQSLAKAGLVSRINYVYSSNVATGSVVSWSPNQGLQPKGSTVDVSVSKGPPPAPVPNLSGLSEASAIQSLAKAGFVSNINYVYSSNVATGSVVSWSPNQGLQPNGATVNVNISQGPPLVTIPNLSGQSYSQASSALTKLGLSVTEVKVFNSTVAVGNVVGTTPSSSVQAQQGSTVTVDVSKGPHLVKVPNVNGHSLSKAEAMLSSAGLKIGSLYGPKKSSVVYGTNPSAGQSVLVGSSIDIYLA